MLGGHLFLERLAVERLGLTAGLVLDQLAPDCVNPGASCLVARIEWHQAAPLNALPSFLPRRHNPKSY